jgi:outer membrane protein OmpA-like peptidoglycan-associated protein
MRHSFLLLLYFFIFSINAQDSIVIYFDFNSASIDKTAEIELNKINKSIVEITGIYGYTDPKGSIVYNKNLAISRINSACNYLNIDNPIENNTAAIGEEFNFSPDDNKNRKVVIITAAKKQEDINLDEQLNKAKIGDKIILKSLNFEPGSNVLLEESKPIVINLYEQMVENPNLIIEIQGNICCADNDSTNLSTDRAIRVYEFLISKGISANRMTYIGFGITNPIHKIPELNERERIANRRVEIKIISN